MSWHNACDSSTWVSETGDGKIEFIWSYIANSRLSYGVHSYILSKSNSNRGWIREGRGEQGREEEDEEETQNCMGQQILKYFLFTNHIALEL